MTAAETLRRARALIDRPYKWIKGAAESGGCYCTAGAILDVCPDDIEMQKAIDRLFKKNVTGGRHIFRWNDARKRTHEEVMAAFDKIIALAESEEVGK